MTDATHAAEQLRAIRTLMERATVYRAISVPTAFIGGMLSVAAFGGVFYLQKSQQRLLTAHEFIDLWLVILFLTVLANAIFLFLQARRRDEPFFSSGMKLASRSLAPAFLTAGLLTLTVHQPLRLATIWLMLYGIGLLSTQHFAPRSLIALGAAFLFAAGGSIGFGRQIGALAGSIEPSTLAASGLMAATFGGFHLVYAVTVWALGEAREPSSPTSEAEHV